MARLLQAFCEGKTDILEEDALILVKWAMAQRMGALVLAMVLDGDLTPTVEGGNVTVALRKSGGDVL